MVNVQSIQSPAIHTEERAHEADHPSSRLALFGADQPLHLDCGIDLAPFQIAYQTYGELNAEKSNAILITHFFSGTSHAAGKYTPGDKAPGYWDAIRKRLRLANDLSHRNRISKGW